MQAIRRLLPEDTGLNLDEPFVEPAVVRDEDHRLIYEGGRSGLA